MGLKELKTEMRSLAVKGQEIVDNAEMTGAEKAEALRKHKDDIAAKSKEIADEEFVAEQRKAFAGMDVEKEPEEGPELRSLGEQFVQSEAYRRQVGEGVQGRKFQTGPVEVKATITGAASPVVQPQVRPGIVDVLFNRLTVADLIPQATTASNVVRSIVETTATNAAAAVAEEGQKPESTLVFDEVDERVAKIATILRAADEMVADAGWLAGYLNQRGVLFVRQAEETQLLNGDGTSPNLSGLLDRSGLVAPVVGGITPDSIHNQITVIRAESFLEPDAIVIHPSDWETLRLSTDANEQYYAGGPFTGAYGNNGVASESIWGLRAVVTPAIAEGTSLVGAFSTSAQIFRRTGITVDMTNSDGDDFTYNRVAFRFEERLALAVYRPQGFGTVTTAA